MLAQPDPTPSSLLVRPLEPARIAQAFPLIAACDPTVTLESWRTLASGEGDFAARQRRAVFIAESPGNRIRGVCAVATGVDAENDLVIERFALCRIGRYAVATALHRTVILTARQWRCWGVRFPLSADAGWLAGFLLEEGYGTVSHSLRRAALYPVVAVSPLVKH